MSWLFFAKYFFNNDEIFSQDDKDNDLFKTETVPYDIMIDDASITKPDNRTKSTIKMDFVDNDTNVTDYNNLVSEYNVAIETSPPEQTQMSQELNIPNTQGNNVTLKEYIDGKLTSMFDDYSTLFQTKQDSAGNATRVINDKFITMKKQSDALSLGTDIDVNNAFKKLVPEMLQAESIKKFIAEFIYRKIKNAVDTDITNKYSIIGIGCPGSGKTLPQLISLVLLMCEHEDVNTMNNLIKILDNYNITIETNNGNNIMFKNNFNFQNKDTLIQELNATLKKMNKKYIEIDQDEVINFFYNLNEYRGLVFDITDFWFNVSLHYNVNIIYASTGRDQYFINELHDKFNSDNYYTKLCIVDIPNETAQKQIRQRLSSEYVKGNIGRDVPDAFFTPSCNTIKNNIRYVYSVKGGSYNWYKFFQYEELNKKNKNSMSSSSSDYPSKKGGRTRKNKKTRKVNRSKKNKKKKRVNRSKKNRRRYSVKI